MYRLLKSKYPFICLQRDDSIIIEELAVRSGLRLKFIVFFAPEATHKISTYCSVGLFQLHIRTKVSWGS